MRAGDALPLGTRRKAKVDGLNLEAADVRLSKNRVEVDEYLRTSNPNIYAAGDVAFPEKFTHAAMASARLCVDTALNGANRRARELVRIEPISIPKAQVSLIEGLVRWYVCPNSSVYGWGKATSTSSKREPPLGVKKANDARLSLLVTWRSTYACKLTFPALRPESPPPPAWTCSRSAAIPRTRSSS